MSFREQFLNQNRGERMIPLTALVQVLELSPLETHNLDKLLKEEAAVYWVKKGGEPEAVRKKPQPVRMRARTPDPHSSDPEYSQALVTDLIARGVLAPKTIYSRPKIPEISAEALATAIEEAADPSANANIRKSHVRDTANRAGLTDATNLDR